MPNGSVPFAVYNGERYIREAVESILRQRYRDFELVVAVDGSDDGTSDIISARRPQHGTCRHT
jgi:glycosyltransferase involved in cell wall biosynthesis